MRRTQSNLTISSVLVAALLAAGCGSSGSSDSQTASTTAPTTSSTSTATTSSAPTTSTAAKREKVPDVDIAMESSVERKPLPAAYTCDGANKPLPVRWSNIPTNTVEIDLFVAQLLPGADEKLVMDWAVAGLKPTVRSISGARLPAGAIVGRNSFGQLGYSVCPPKGKKVQYEVIVDPLQQRFHVKPGFNEEALLDKAVHTAESEGQLGFSYTRR